MRCNHMFHLCLLPLDIPDRLCFKLQNVQLKKFHFKAKSILQNLTVLPLAETLLKHCNSLLLIKKKKNYLVKLCFIS